MFLQFKFLLFDLAHRLLTDSLVRLRIFLYSLESVHWLSLADRNTLYNSHVRTFFTVHQICSALILVSIADRDTLYNSHVRTIFNCALILVIAADRNTLYNSPM